MSTTIRVALTVSGKTILGLTAGLAVVMTVSLSFCAERGGPPHGQPSRPVEVARPTHGTVRHVDTHAVQRPVEAPREPSHPVDVHREPEPRHDIVVHHDVEADLHRPRFWSDFAFGRRLPTLPVGFLSLQIGGVPYFYCNGIYYQSAAGSYQEVYPPVGAAVPQPPDGAIAIEAGGVTYYFAGGAFYLQQPDGTFAVAPTPIGVVVPELPPGAVQVSVNGNVAYQFNGIYYEPIFVNGVTQYQTFTP